VKSENFVDHLLLRKIFYFVTKLLGGAGFERILFSETLQSERKNKGIVVETAKVGFKFESD